MGAGGAYTCPNCGNPVVWNEVDTGCPRKACRELIALRARIAGLEKVVEYAEHHPGCGYTFDHVTQTGELVGCTCGLEAALDAAKEGRDDRGTMGIVPTLF